MARGKRGWLVLSMVIAACALLAGCNKSGMDSGPLSTLKAGRFVVTGDTFTTPTTCTATSAGGVVTQSCKFVDSGTGLSSTATVQLTGLGPYDGMQPGPVGVLQVTADAAAFTGTFDNRHGGSGALVFTPGFARLPQDAQSTLVAEPGMQLVVVEFPPGTPADTYFIVVSYQSASRTDLKVFSAGKVAAAGGPYYPLLVPCVDSPAAVPDVPVPQTTVETLVNLSTLATAYVTCDGRTYRYASASTGTVTVVEYYNAALDHYFITWHDGEIAILDEGVAIKGWRRTGKTFRAYLTASSGTSDICRFYIPPAQGDSHFFGRGTVECDATAVAHPNFVNEDRQFMQMILPTAGNCPPATIPVYREFSNRADANHRYMIDRSTRDAMVAHGWLAEGDGPDLVVMCAPT
jgi:hypothetical protein